MKIRPSIMLDLETMDTVPGGAIISIGAVKFSSDTGITERFYTRITPESCDALGMTFSLSTAAWWMRQSAEARAVFEPKGALHIAQALSDFAVFAESDGERLIWGNGADFDNAMLAAAYRMNHRSAPWKFWNNACYRTIKNLYPSVKLNREGVHHNALDDAEFQALHLLKIAAQIPS